MRQLRASRVLPVVSLLLLLSLAGAQENASVVPASPELDATGSGNSVAIEPVDSSVLSPNITDTAAGNETDEAAAPVVSSPEPLDTDNSTAVPEAPQPVRVDQVLPFFKGVRSCLPFNILIAAPQRPVEGEDNVAQVVNGRITILADRSVINATAVAVEDDVLTLSLVGDGFFSIQPINFIVTIPPSGGDFESVTNSGSGTVMLGPGLNTSSLRINAARVGEVNAINVTASTLEYAGAGAFSSTLTGAFDEVSINAGTTGTVVLTSVTPVSVTVNLQGITTVKVGAPEGSIIQGRASGLSSVQYTNGECNIAPQSGLLDDVFGDRCSSVTSDVVTAAFEGASNPQWTCGVVVDGQLSCTGRNVSSREEVSLEIIGDNEGQSGETGETGASTAPEGTTGNFTTPPPEFDNSTATNVGGNAADAGSNAAKAGSNAAIAGSNAANAGNNAANTGSNAANVGENSANVGGNAANGGINAAPQIDAGLVVMARPSPVPSAVANPATNAAAIPDSSTNVIGVNSAGPGNAAGLSGTINAIPEGTGARRLLKTTFLGRRLQQTAEEAGTRAFPTSSFFNFPSFPDFPSLPLVVQRTPAGTLGTGSQTSGQGSFSSSSSTVDGVTQTTTSQGGSPPVTTTTTEPTGTLFNPVFVEGEGAAAPSTSPSPTPTSPAPSPAVAADTPQSTVSVNLGGEGTSGIAVVNTQCAVNTSLNMLLTGDEVTGDWVQPIGGTNSAVANAVNGTAVAPVLGGNAAVNSTTDSNATDVGGNAAGVGGNAAGVGSNATNAGGDADGTSANTGNTGLIISPETASAVGSPVPAPDTGA